MSCIAGIDFSTKAVDIVLLDEDTHLARQFSVRLDFQNGEDAFDRTRKVRAVMPSRGTWEAEGVIAVGLEEPRGYGTDTLFRVQGAILQCFPPNLLIQPWIPSAWRKACGLKGNGTKQETADWVNELHGWDLGWSYDAYDAYGIAYATRSVLETLEAA